MQCLPIKILRVRGVRGRPLTEYCVYCCLDACLHCMVLSCTQLNCVVVSRPFFLWSPCYTLSRKKDKIIIRGGFGSTWGHNSYIGSKLEF
jgi:hypothetical protein